MSEEEVEEEACKLEHILSPGVTESVCTFLGHPPTCIHGKPIPRGECCSKFKKEMKPLVIPLEELGLGEEGRIVFIAPKSHQRLDRLSTLGIVPGSILRMHQKNPSHVLQIGETTLALDKEIVKRYLCEEGLGQESNYQLPITNYQCPVLKNYPILPT